MIVYRHSCFWNGRYLIGINIIGSKYSNIFSRDKVNIQKFLVLLLSLLISEPPEPCACGPTTQMLTLCTLRMASGPRANSSTVLDRAVKQVGKHHLVQQWKRLTLCSARTCLKDSRCTNSILGVEISISQLGELTTSPNPWTRRRGSRETHVNSWEPQTWSEAQEWNQGQGADCGCKGHLLLGLHFKILSVPPPNLQIYK